MDKKKSVAAMLGVTAGFGAARAVDIALIGGGVATAASAVAFAGYMTLAGGADRPLVNGMEYLAIFAQPSHPRHAGQDIDDTPVGAIPHDVKDHVAGYALVGAQPAFAWLREGNRIFSVRPGENVPRLGRIAAIEQRDGRWTLVDDKGAPLIVSALTDLSPSPGGVKFDKRMIFGTSP